MAKIIDKRYGVGIDLFLDVTNNVRSASGINIVRNAVVGRLIDKLWYDKTYGIQLPQKLLNVNGNIDYALLARQCENEIKKDDRVGKCSVIINPPDSDGNVTVDITVVTKFGESFSLIGSLNTITQGRMTFV